MARKKVGDLLVEVLLKAGVRQIYGVSGDSLNGITDSIRETKQFQWIHVRHEETAAFAAGAEAHLTGRLAGSCDPGFSSRKPPGAFHAAHDHSRADERLQPLHPPGSAQRPWRGNRRPHKDKSIPLSRRKKLAIVSEGKMFRQLGPAN
jgi:Thiamine pyrophosphate enzyme, N-terminal TPP binding domain